MVGVVEIVATGREAELVLFIVGFEQVSEYCAGFPDGEVCVWVVDCGEAAVWVMDCVAGIFDFGVWDVDYFVGKVEFAEEDGDF